jgi:uncharacterized protein (DUF1499 family)
MTHGLGSPCYNGRMNWKIALLVVGGMILLPAVGLALLSAFSRRPSNLGVVDGRLAPCPESPNCVSTQAQDAIHRMEPISYNGSAEDAVTRIRAVISSRPRTKIVTEKGNYLHVEFVSALFRFVDDVEFLIDESNGKIDFRSASRVGYGDLGANRKRMKAISAEFGAQ